MEKDAEFLFNTRYLQNLKIKISLVKYAIEDTIYEKLKKK